MPPKPPIPATSNLTPAVGALIADHVHDDLLAELLAVRDEMRRQGYGDIDLHAWRGQLISQATNNWGGVQSRLITVGSVAGMKGGQMTVVHVHYYPDADLVGADWKRLEGE